MFTATSHGHTEHGWSFLRAVLSATNPSDQGTPRPRGTGKSWGSHVSLSPSPENMANRHFAALGDVWKPLPLAEILRLRPPTHYWETHAGSPAYALTESPA